LTLVVMRMLPLLFRQLLYISLLLRFVPFFVFELGLGVWKPL